MTETDTTGTHPFGTVAVLGAGKLGTVLGRLLVGTGHRVLVAGSGDPDRIRLILSVVAPGTEAVRADDAVDQADVVVLALPLGRLDTVPVERLRGKVVIDAMNHWWEVDGHRPDLEDGRVSTSALVQQHLPGATVVKAFNHMGYHDLDAGARPVGDPERKAIAVAGDDEPAVAAVAALVEELGFDAVAAGSLSDSVALEPHAEAFGANVPAPELVALVERFPTTDRGRAVAAARAGLPA
jgi:predicted dinucleotide-binding enzyme